MMRRRQSQPPYPPPNPTVRRLRRLLETSIGALLGLLVISGVLTTALAAEPAPDDLCADAMTQAAMRACLNARYQEVDVTLNQVYKQLMAQLSSTQKTKFKQAQRAWITFRDASAAFAASTAEGGSLAPTLSLAELVSMTEARVVAMQEILRALDAR